MISKVLKTKFAIKMQVTVFARLAMVGLDVINVCLDFLTIRTVYLVTVPYWEVYRLSAMQPENVHVCQILQANSVLSAVLVTFLTQNAFVSHRILSKSSPYT